MGDPLPVNLREELVRQAIKGIILIFNIYWLYIYMRYHINIQYILVMYIYEILYVALNEDEDKL